MLDLDQLKTFLVAAELSNFTHAARRLHLSQSAVSQQIRELENQLGCSLFVRAPRCIILTPAGDRLLPLARKLLEDVRTAEEVIRATAFGDQGVVRVAASPFTATLMVLPALGAFTQVHPGIRICVDVFPADAVADVYRDDAYDLALTEGRAPALRPPGFEVLRTEPLVAASAPALMPTAEADASAMLAGVPLVAWPEQSAAGACVRAGLSAAGVDLERTTNALLIADALVQARAAASGLGLAFLPRLAAAADLESGRLRAWELPGFQASLEVWALASAKEGAATIFLSWLSQYAAAEAIATVPPAVPGAAAGNAAQVSWRGAPNHS